MQRPRANDGSAADTRLQVWLARCGVGSRRRCEELIAAGRIAVNGEVVTRMGTKVSSGDSVTLDGKPLKREEKKVTLAVHKPKGYLCSASDEEGRPLVSDLFREAVSQRLFHVGRLDFMSTGLILYTNDGELAKRIGHPGAGIEKEYLVETADPIDPGFLEEYRRGIWVEGVLYRCVRYSVKNPRAALIVLREGKNRELRNVFMGRRLKVKRVHRLRIGPITLRSLPPGHFRPLTEREIAWFMAHSGKSERPFTSDRPRTLEARRGPADASRRPEDADRKPRDAYRKPRDTRQGPRDTRQGPRDTRQGPEGPRGRPQGRSGSWEGRPPGKRPGPGPRRPRDTRPGPRGPGKGTGRPGRGPEGGRRGWK